MIFNWLTWGVWGIGVIILVLWMIGTIKEFRILFTEQSDVKEKDEQGHK